MRQLQRQWEHQKTKRFNKQNYNFACALHFLYISLWSLHENDEKKA